MNTSAAANAAATAGATGLNALLVLVLIVWAVSALGLIIFVLLHSGKGTGLSEMLGASLSPTASGTSIIEKNLDRITIGFAIAFMVSLILLMIIYPTSA